MSAADEILLAQANERLRQERETFDQRKDQDRRAFLAQNAMSWVIIFTLPSILIAAACILIFHGDFDATTVKLAASALLVDGLGAAVSIYKSNAGRMPRHILSPVTTAPKLPAPSRGRGARSAESDATQEKAQTTEAS